MQPFPHPTDNTHKIWPRLANWSYRYSCLKVSVYKEFFWWARAYNTKVTDLIPPDFKNIQDFIPVLVTSKFDEDLIKNECASLETPFSHYKSGKFFRHSRTPHFKGRGLVWFLFYGPLTHFRSFRARSVNLATLFLCKLLRQFTST